MAEAFVSRRRYGPRTDRFFYTDSELHDSDTLDAFGLSEAVLRNLYNDEAQNINIQRAALAIYLSQDFYDTEIIKEKFYQYNLDTLIVKLMNDSPPIWLVTSLFMFGEKHLNHNDSRSIVLIGHCFDIYRDNYKVRMMMHLLLNNWRERSSAPVDNAQVLNTWLTQTL
jgi:hypothetical protein